MRTPASMEPDQVLGERYRLVRELGSGGMGTVFEGVQLDLERRVAIKVLRTDAPMSERQFRRFEREARAGARLAHPNIVQVTDFGVSDGRPFLVMELLRGESMRALLHRERVLEPRPLVQILGPILAALAYAHGEGIVHRDVKPDNIFLVPTEHGIVPKLVDFGIARDDSHRAAPLTATHHTLGTAAYMAPEQVRETRRVTAPADQYAVGVILFEALTGRLPHGGSAVAAAAAKLMEGAPPLASLRPDLPAELTRAVDRALSMDPAARYASASAMRAALVAAVGSSDDASSAFGDTVPAGVLSVPSERTIEPLETPEPPRTGEPSESGEPRARASAPTPAPSPEETATRRNAPVARPIPGVALFVAASGFLAIGVVAGAIAWQSQHPPPAPAPSIEEEPPARPAVVAETERPTEAAPEPVGGADPIPPLPTVSGSAGEGAVVAPLAVPAPRARRSHVATAPSAPRVASHASIASLRATGYTDWTARSHLDSIRRGVDRCVAAASVAPGARTYQVTLDESGRATRATRAGGGPEPALDACVETALRHAGWSPPMGRASVEVTYRLD